MVPTPVRHGRVSGLGALAVPALGAAVLMMAVGCGDPILPSDYAGPPAAMLSGVVFQGPVAPREASQPRLSLEWLTDFEAAPGQSTLVGQPLRFSRSVKLQNDWDIGLDVPIDGAKLPAEEGTLSSERVRVGVGKMVYFDDRNGNGRLDWTCRTGVCDQAQAISYEYVVYVEGGIKCRSAGVTGANSESYGRPSTGYNYYRFENSSIRTVPAGEPMNFLMTDRSLPDSDPSDELRSFARLLLGLWQLGQLSGGC